MGYMIETKPYGVYDVVVCGGGTAGVCAAIASARQGAKTLLVERTFAVGGMLTIGDAGITKFTEHCKDVDVYKDEVLDVLGENPRDVQVVGGIAHEFVIRLIKEGNALGTSGEAGSYVFTDKYEAQLTLINMLEEAGVEVLYDSRVCLANKKNGSIESIVVCNKEGFCQITATEFIDATGDADIAALSGVDFVIGASEKDVEEGCAKEVRQMQNFGIMYRVRNVNFEKLFDYLEKNPDKYHQNEFGVMSLENARKSYEDGEMSVFRFKIEVPGEESLKPVQVYNLPEKDEAILLGPFCGYEGDGLDARSVSRGQEACQRAPHRLNEILKRNIPGFENVKTIFAPDVGVRETRHIIGEYTLTGVDVLSGKNFNDSIGCGGHPIDIHPIPPEIEDMSMNHWRFHIPYRIMLSKNVKNLLVTGRCVSATRIASGAIRPTAQCMVMGEAAGIAAALAKKHGVDASEIDINELRKLLEENGAIL